MVSLAKFKKSLGSLAEKMSDDEIERVRELQYQLADILFDVWLEDKNKEQN